MLETLALGCRSVILASLMISAALALINAYAHVKRGNRESLRSRRLSVLKGGAVAIYGAGAIYGTYMRIDKEFSPSLPAMALGALMYTIYLWCANDDDPKAPADPVGISR